MLLDVSFYRRLCCLWTCLSYSSLVLPLHCVYFAADCAVSEQPWLPLDVYLFYSSLCCLWMRLFYSNGVCAVPVRVYDVPGLVSSVPGGVCPTAAVKQMCQIKRQQRMLCCRTDTSTGKIRLL